MPQAEGMKSRCRLVTTMTKRSSHIPVWITSEITNSASTFCRILRRPEKPSAGIAILHSDEHPVDGSVRAGHAIHNHVPVVSVARCKRP